MNREALAQLVNEILVPHADLKHGCQLPHHVRYRDP